MLKSKFLFVLLVVLSSIISRGQQNDGIKYIRNAGVVVEAFEKITYYKKQQMPFKQVIVIDKRFDSSKTGYATTGFLQGYAKVVLKQSWSATLNNYFQNNLTPSSDKSLVIVLKSFWLQRGAMEQLVDKKIAKIPVASNGEYGGICSADMDIYVQSDSSLQALFRIENNFMNLAVRYQKSRIDEFFFLPFDSIARRLVDLNVPEVLTKKRKLTWKEVNDYYDQRFDIPVLKDTGIKKGVFKTFDEFKQNKPYISSFKFVNGRITDELYSTDNGREDIITEYWGFYDGKDLYIQAGLSAFKAIRQHNSFELFGSKIIGNYHNNPSQNDIRISGYEINRKILQVNMNTGKIY